MIRAQSPERHIIASAPVGENVGSGPWVVLYGRNEHYRVERSPSEKSASGDEDGRTRIPQQALFARNVYDPDEGCVCRMCGLPCPRYHANNCDRVQSLAKLASFELNKRNIAKCFFKS